MGREKKIKKDFILTVEVKSNRPDCLSVVGILREIYAYYQKQYKLKQPKNQLQISNEKFRYKIQIIDDNICHRFSIIINNINNKNETPDFIKEFLSSVGCNLVNPAVDITNYITLTYGQPLHIYDADKPKGGSYVKKNIDTNNKIHTFENKAISINDKESIVISDEKDTLVLAGIIGSKKSGVDKSTKNILIECANFNKERIRYASKKYKISTFSSFRYERGVDINNHEFILNHVSDFFVKYLYGNVDNNMFDYYPHTYKKNRIEIYYSYINKVLGCKLSKNTIKKNLNKYGLKYKDIIKGLVITPPEYRLDI